ncbi:MAG: ABC transporter permease [Promethearchaeota archaeon]
MAQAQNMIKYIFKRILLMFPMLIMVLIFTWLLSHMMAVSPVTNKIGFTMDPDVYENELKRIGFYDPWYIKLGNYIGNFFTGDWGKSYIIQADMPVLELIGRIFPKTIELMILPNIIVPYVAIRLGVVSAKNKNRAKDSIIRGGAILGAGFPVFWIASLIQIFVGSTLKQFTAYGFIFEVVLPNSPKYTTYTPYPGGAPHTGFRIIDSLLYNDQIYLWDTLMHLILPVACMCLVSLAGVTRQTRSSMLDVLDQDYIRSARAKGVRERVVIHKHALRNALIPTSNLIIGGFSSLFLGSLFIEVTFNYTGYGYWMVNSIFRGDYLVINGLLVFSTLIIIGGTLLADIMYTVIDPRISYR